MSSLAKVIEEEEEVCAPSVAESVKAHRREKAQNDKDSESSKESQSKAKKKDSPVRRAKPTETESRRRGSDIDRLCLVMQEGFQTLNDSMKNVGESISQELNDRLIPLITDNENDVYDYAVSEEEEEERSVLEEIALDLEPEEKVGPKIGEEVANLLSSFLSKSCSESSKRRKEKEHARPENCEVLRCPKMNPEVWNVLPGKSRVTDSTLQKAQGSFLNSITPIAKCIEELHAAMVDNKESEIDAKKLIRNLCDSVTYIANGNEEIFNIRKDLVKPHLPDSAQKLCRKGNFVPGDLLFGENFTQQLKEINEANKLTTGLMKFKSLPPTTPYRGRSNVRTLRGRSYRFPSRQLRQTPYPTARQGNGRRPLPYNRGRRARL